MGLHNPTLLGGNSHLSWFYDRGAIKDPAHTGTSKGIAQAIKRGPIRKFLPNYANVYVTIQSHALSAGVRPHYVTANRVRNGQATVLTFNMENPISNPDPLHVKEDLFLGVKRILMAACFSVVGQH